MSLLNDAIEYMSRQKGVINVFEMDDTVSADIDAIEKSIKTRTNHDYVSIGYDYALERKHRLCILFTDDFRRDFRTRLQLTTTDGTILGTNVYPEELDEYSKREDVIFVSDDFVVFPEIHGEGEERFILYPFDFTELQDAVPGTSNSIGFFPTPSSDHYLKELTNTPESQFIFSTIIAFDD